VERLLVARLEAMALTDPVVRLALELDGRTPQAGSQLGLFTPQSANAAQLDWQLAGLAIRFGAARLWRVGIGDPEAPLPEARTTWTPAGAEPATPGDRGVAPDGRVATHRPAAHRGSRSR
jgi:hypothetical protein